MNSMDHFRASGEEWAVSGQWCSDAQTYKNYEIDCGFSLELPR